MKIILNEDCYLVKGKECVFPKGVEIKTIVYKNIRYMVHPTEKGILKSLPNKNLYKKVEEKVV